jgi:hypothetical protein
VGGPLYVRRDNVAGLKVIIIILLHNIGIGIGVLEALVEKQKEKGD